MTTSTDLAFLGNDQKEMPAHLVNLEEDRNLGNENVGAEDQEIPRLNLLQSLSPQLDTLEEAKAGMFHNSVTDELYREVFLINLFFKKEYVVWRDRKKGGGYCGAYANPEAAHAQIESLPGTAEDYNVQETAKHACLLLDPETGAVKQPILVFMKSTGLSISRNWNSRIENAGDGVQVPRFASVWRVGSQKQEKNGNTWYNWTIENAGWVPEELFQEAKAFYNSVQQHV